MKNIKFSMLPRSKLGRFCLQLLHSLLYLHHSLHDTWISHHLPHLRILQLKHNGNTFISFITKRNPHFIFYGKQIYHTDAIFNPLVVKMLASSVASILVVVDFLGTSGYWRLSAIIKINPMYTSIKHTNPYQNLYKRIIHT